MAFHIVHVPRYKRKHTKYVLFVKTRIQSEWKSSLAKQWTVPFRLLSASNMVEIQSKEKAHFFCSNGKKGCVKILYLNLANLLHRHTHSLQENGEDTHGQLCCLVDDATVACSAGFSVVHSIKFTSAILCDGCSQPLKMQEGHQTN